MSKNTIAIFGGHGVLVQPTLDALTSSQFSSNISYPIKVITRSIKSGEKSHDKIKYVESNSTESLDASFKDVDVIINLAGAGPYLQDDFLKSVIKAHPKLYIPPEFGSDLDKITMFPGFMGIKQVHSIAVRDAGIKTVDIVNGSFYALGSWLYEIVAIAGIDTDSKVVTYRGDPNDKFSATSVIDVGKTVAVIATSKDFSKVPNKVRIYSELLSQKKIAAKYEENHNVKLTEKFIDKSGVAAEAKENFKDGHIDYNKFFFYLQAMNTDAVNNGMIYTENERELINPNESVFKWTKY